MFSGVSLCVALSPLPKSLSCFCVFGYFSQNSENLLYIYILLYIILLMFLFITNVLPVFWNFTKNRNSCFRYFYFIWRNLLLMGLLSIPSTKFIFSFYRLQGSLLIQFLYYSLFWFFLPRYCTTTSIFNIGL